MSQSTQHQQLYTRIRDYPGAVLPPSGRIAPLHIPDGVTPSEIVRRLGVLLETLTLWRKGSSRRAPLPALVERYGKASKVIISENELIKWLNQYRPDLVYKWSQD